MEASIVTRQLRGNGYELQFTGDVTLVSSTSYNDGSGSTEYVGRIHEFGLNAYSTTMGGMVDDVVRQLMLSDDERVKKKIEVVRPTKGQV